MHIKLTLMKKVAPLEDDGSCYEVTQNSIYMPVEDLKQAVICQEGTCYRVFSVASNKYGKGQCGEFVVKENPIELLKKYDEEKEEERKKIINELGRGKQ